MSFLFASTMCFAIAAPCPAITDQPQATSESHSRWHIVSKNVRPGSETNKPATRDVEILGPRSTCFGRFSDSLRDHVLKAHPFVYSVKLDRMFESPEEFQESTKNIPRLVNGSLNGAILGAPTRITIEIDENVTDEELFQALTDDGAYNLKQWRVLREVTISEILKKQREPEGPSDQSSKK